MHYLHDIIAADVASGVFLSQFLRRLRVTRSFAGAMEIIDLQRYKVIKKPAKVLSAIQELKNESFVFLIGKN